MSLAPECVYPALTIAARVSELGAQVRDRFGDRPVVVLGVLSGARPFADDLAAAIGDPVEVVWVKARSYLNETVSSGTLDLGPFPGEALHRSRVAVADTICDTGLTLSAVLSGARDYSPVELISCVLVNKRARRSADVTPDFVGFEAEDRFLVGYGLDFAGRYRDLPYVGVLEQEAHV